MDRRTPPDAERIPVAPASLTDRYRIERRLGGGGMGEVFEATDTQLHRRVALKRLDDPLARDAAAGERFLREAWALARVNHPNVVSVFDVGEHEGRPSLVMELVEGESLQRKLERDGPLPPAEAGAIASAIASGLGAAHARGIVHRDVKPSNVILSDDGRIRIVDFGIARLTDAVTLTRTSAMFGSPPYIAPEQVTDPRQVDARADLYALGCVLFQMLTGRPPFEGKDAVSLSYRHVHETAPRVDAIRPGVPPELTALVAGLLEKAPADRPRTAGEVVGTLASIAEPRTGDRDETIERLPTAPMPSRVHRNARRRLPGWLPWAAVALAIALIALVLMQLAGGSDRPRPGAAGPTTTATSSASASSSPSATTTPPAPTDTASAAATLLALTRELEAHGQIDEHLAGDIEHAVGDAQHKANEDPDKAIDPLNELRDKISEAGDEHDITPGAAMKLTAAIDALVSTLGEGRD